LNQNLSAVKVEQGNDCKIIETKESGGHILHCTLKCMYCEFVKSHRNPWSW